MEIYCIICGQETTEPDGVCDECLDRLETKEVIIPKRIWREEEKILPCLQR